MNETTKNNAVHADGQRYNHLAAVEMDAEGNYNMIDGVINNAKPSILEHLRNHRTAAADKGEKPERCRQTER